MSNSMVADDFMMVDVGLIAPMATNPRKRFDESALVELTAHDVRVAFYWPLGVAILALVAGGFVWWIRRR